MPSLPPDDAAFLASYREQKWPRPAVTVDLVILTVIDSDLKVLLIQRNEPPFKGSWALPGGFVRVGDTFDDQGEDVEAAAHRELAEETGLPRGSAYLEQLFTFGKTGRDPRTRVITVAYYALVRPTLAPLVTAGTDAADARWASVAAIGGLLDPALGFDRRAVGDGEVRGLAFDHAEILSVAIERVRGKLAHAPIGFDLVPETFTTSELRTVHEAIHGTNIDPSNFRRRIKRMIEDGLIEQAPGMRQTATRPATVYRFKKPRRA